jgi:hypothetical protein
MLRRLWERGKDVAHTIEEECFSRLKHEYCFPTQAWQMAGSCARPFLMSCTSNPQQVTVEEPWERPSGPITQFSGSRGNSCLSTHIRGKNILAGR